MSNVDEISVALGTYNGGSFLLEQLNSLAMQTTKPMELVVCDDLSNDDTVQILQDFAKVAPFPVHIHVNESRLGFGDNFLKAARLCKGFFISFCDQDDVWYPEKLEVSAKSLMEHEAVLCAHDADLGAGNGDLIGYHSAGIDSGTYDPLSLHPWGAFFGFTCMFRRDLLDIIDPALRPEDTRDPSRLLAHDGWIYFLGITFGRTVYIAKPLAKYRQHGANLFGSNDLTGLRKLQRLITGYEAYLQKYQRLAAARVAILGNQSAPWPAEYARSGAEAYRYWKNIAALQNSRLAIVAKASLIGRCRKVAALWRQGAYAPLTTGGLGRRALAEDWVAAFARLFFK